MFGYLAINESEQVKDNSHLSELKRDLKTTIPMGEVEVSDNYASFGWRFYKAVSDQETSKLVMRKSLQIFSPAEHAVATPRFASHLPALVFQPA